jgi:DNA-binding CsgD family transcriptional regulator
VLVGRRAELDVIERLLAGARVGQSGALVLVGEAGIGKSALLQAAASRAAGMRLLRATGSVADRDVAFGGLLALLRPALGLFDRLPAPQAAALGGALALGPGADRFAVGAATLTLICRYAEEAPVAVIVDDAHLLDPPSADALAFAARRLMADPVAVLAAVRSPEPDALTGAGLPRLVVAGLDRTASGELVAAQSRGPVATDAVDQLHRATAGNPLALLELADDIDRLVRQPDLAPVPMPVALAEAFAVRTSRLAPAARTVLLLAAASDGDLAVLDVAAARNSLGLAALAEAERAGLVHLEAGRVRFRHPLVRSAVYAGAAPDERRAVHAALAEAVPAHDVERRAWHLTEAALGPDEAAARVCEEAATGARSRSAHAVAATAYERAARLSPEHGQRVRRMVAAGESALFAGQVQRACALVDETSPRPADPLLRVRVEELRGAVAARGGSMARARDILVAAAHEASGVDPDAATVLLADAVYVCFFLGDARSALAAADRIKALLPKVGSARATVVGTMAVGIALVLAGRAGEAELRQATQMMATSDVLEDDPGRTAWLVYGPLFLREPGTGRELVERVVADTRERAAIGALPLLLFLVARYDATTDRWSAAESGYAEAIRLARETGQSADLAAALAGLAWLNARQGRVAECQQHAREAIAISQERDLHTWRAWSLFALGELELGRGHVAAALDHLQPLDAMLAEIGLLDPDLSPAPELTDALMRVGRAEEARQVAARFGRRAAAKGQPWALARAARAEALVGPDVDLDRHFATAFGHHARALDPFEHARSQLVYGMRLRRARRRAEARPLLRACVATFDELGATPWAETAAAELKATGETARRRGPSTVDALTPQELQIAQLLADGRTTRQAAAALFLSPKTIEYHLRHVYTKLTIASRDELARAMRPPGR